MELPLIVDVVESSWFTFGHMRARHGGRDEDMSVMDEHGDATGDASGEVSVCLTV